MKIAFSGVSGSGKTTIVPIIANKFAYNAIYSKISITNHKYNIELNQKEFNYKLQEEILDTQIKNESELSNFITDRSILDILAYTASYYADIDSKWFIQFHKKIIDNYSYDIIIKFPFNILPNNDTYIKNLLINSVLYSIISTESKMKHFKVIEIPYNMIKSGIKETSNFIINCIESYLTKQSIISRNNRKRNNND